MGRGIPADSLILSVLQQLLHILNEWFRILLSILDFLLQFFQPGVVFVVRWDVFQLLPNFCVVLSRVISHHFVA